MPGRGDGDVEVGVVEVVLVLSLTIVGDSHGVGKLVVGVAQLVDLGEVVLVFDVEVGRVDRPLCTACHEAVWAQHRRLGVGEEVDGCHRGVVVVAGSAGVEEVARGVGK